MVMAIAQWTLEREITYSNRSALFSFYIGHLQREDLPLLL